MHKCNPFLAFSNPAETNEAFSAEQRYLDGVKIAELLEKNTKRLLVLAENSARLLCYCIKSYRRNRIAQSIVPNLVKVYLRIHRHFARSWLCLISLIAGNGVTSSDNSTNLCTVS